ncbi:hypothetical protein [Umboniibacter marinipuniceus]|uniref:Uncharacterized protein n=1 Tax=Umboniibacter marinipuniceus TaxID=569599 RepID=A0A3M0AEP7_9GAMM|nr:hypothetical protein [Umboniibacter marinipuniceus]RMA77662.1 hypothetical protein DFR27_2482 [Umboniibacter marinipuniceus]
MLHRTPFTVFVILLTCWPVWVWAQSDKDHFTALLEIQDVDFGDWDGVDIAEGTVIPIADEGFCFIFSTKKETEYFRVNYALSVEQKSNGTPYTLLGANGANLPVRFNLSKKTGNTTNTPNAVPLLPGDAPASNFSEPVATKNNELNASTQFASQTAACTANTFDFSIQILGSDIAALGVNALSAFTGTFDLVADPTEYNGAGKTDPTEFTVSITISSSVYLSQLPTSIDLNTQTSANFCIWSFASDDVNITLSGVQAAPIGGLYNFGLIETAGGTPAQTIGYNVDLTDLRQTDTRTQVGNGIAETNMSSVGASEYNCTGANGLNYQLDFDLEDASGKRAGAYKDTLTVSIQAI